MIRSLIRVRSYRSGLYSLTVGPTLHFHWTQQELPNLAVQDESSLAGHVGERAPRTADDEDEGADVAEDGAEDAVDVPDDAEEGPSGDS